MSKLADYFFKPSTGGFTSGAISVKFLSHMPKMSKAHWYHKPYCNDFDKAYERALEEKDDKRREDVTVDD